MFMDEPTSGRGLLRGCGMRVTSCLLPMAFPGDPSVLPVACQLSWGRLWAGLGEGITLCAPALCRQTPLLLQAWMPVLLLLS